MKVAYIIAGLGFGDEGKGATTDWLTRFEEASLVVRYNGGPQNSHTVVLPDGKHHTFRQFGSGTLIPGVRTHLSEHVLISPVAMMIENSLLKGVGVKDAFNRLTIAADAVVITPYQRAANVLAEIVRGVNAYGSCGVGLGDARKDSIIYPDSILRAKHLKDKAETMARLKFIEELHEPEIRVAHQLITGRKTAPLDDPVVVEALEWFDGGPSREHLWDRYRDFPLHTILPDEKWTLRDILLTTDHVVVFEGSQGVMLDESNTEFFPHVTWTDTTFRNALDLIEAATVRRSPETMPKIVKIGCLRPYATRHGNGPLPREDASLTKHMQETTQRTEHNKTNRFQGSLRYGFLDLVQVKKAIAYIGGVHYISMSCMDHLFDAHGIHFYDADGHVQTVPHACNVGMHTAFVDFMQKEIGAPITVLGYGPSYTSRFLRMTS